MQATFKTEALRDRLTSLLRITDSRSSATARTEALSHAMLSVKKDGSTIWATNLSETLRHPIEATVTEEGSTLVPARKLAEIVKELEGDITMKTDTGAIVLTSGKSKFRVACLPVEQYPAWPDPGDTAQIAIDPETLSRLISETQFAADDKSSHNYSMHAVLFHLVPEAKSGIRLVATNGARLATEAAQLKTVPAEEARLLVPKKAAAEMLRVLHGSESASITWNKRYMVITAGKTIMAARLLEGTYPAYEKVIPQDHDIHIRLNREAFESALKRMHIIGRENSNGVVLNIAENSLEMSSAARDIGDANDQMPVDYSGQPIKATFDCRYLLDAMGQVKGETVLLNLSQKKSPALITTEQGTWQYVLMPMNNK